MTNLKFFWNGIKDSTGKLHTVSYSEGPFTRHAAGTIAIYKREYSKFPAEIREAFTVKNDTDSMTDYFEADKIYVTPDHNLYQTVKEAVQANKDHYKKAAAKRYNRCIDPTGHGDICHSDADPGL